MIPGLSPSPALFGPQEMIERLWHFAFNRLPELNEELVAGRERLYFGWQFATKAATPLAPSAVEVYLGSLTASRAALHASFGPYRALDTTIAQNTRRRERRLAMPVLTIAGERSVGAGVEATIGPVADDVRGHLVLPGCGHFPAEEAPDAVLEALTGFLDASSS
jgi:pimeloyl-ACP methyl ester carboxylesterase